jgi:hypothetical protein
MRRTRREAMDDFYDGPDRGSATAEYAIVTVAAAGFAAVLVALLKSPEVRDMLLGLVRSALGS